MTNQAIPEGNGGWIKLHRRFLDSREFGSNPATFKVCIYLMLAANHKLRYVRGIKVERGQCIRSLSMISDDCSLSRKAVRCALGNLERSGFIHVDAPFGAQQGHRVSVCNYATYQGEEADKGTEGISEGYHEGNTNKNGKKEKKVRQQELLPPNGGEGASGTCPGNVPDSNDGSTPVEQPLSERSGQAERVKTFKQWDRADIVAAIAEANQDRLLTPAECADFADYWLEPTPTGRTRMSLERTWDTRRRMQTALRVVFSKQRPGAQSTGGAKYAIVN